MSEVSQEVKRLFTYTPLAGASTGELLEKALNSLNNADHAWEHEEPASVVLELANEARDYLGSAIARLEAHCGD